MTELYTSPGINCYFDREVMRIALSRCPEKDTIDHMWTILSTFLVNHPKQCMLHLQHVETEDKFDPPSLAVLIHIVSKILSDKTLSERCKKIVIQPQFVDEKVLSAQTIFLGLLQQKLNVKIEDRDEEVSRTIEKFRSKNNVSLS